MSDSQKNSEKKITLSLDIKMPRVGFDLKNTFNLKAIGCGLLTAAGIWVAMQTGFALHNWHYAVTPLQHAFAAATAGGAGLWHAHAVGGQTTIGSNKPLTAMRNLAFTGTSMIAPAIAVGVLSASIAPGIGALIGAGIGATIGATCLNWSPKPRAPVPNQ